MTASLFSETTSVPSDHTKLATLLESAPSVPLIEFASQIATSLDQIDRMPSASLAVKEKLRNYATGIVAATVEMSTALETEEEDFEAPDIRQHFSAIDLPLSNASQQCIDAGLQFIFKNSEIGRQFNLSNHSISTEIYLFRIATLDPDHDMVVEVSRRYRPSRIGEAAVQNSGISSFELQFSGFESATATTAAEA